MTQPPRQAAPAAGGTPTSPAGPVSPTGPGTGPGTPSTAPWSPGPGPATPAAVPGPRGSRGPTARSAPWHTATAHLRTEPGRLRALGALLALLILAFGAVTAWQVTARAAAAGNVLDHSAPLSADAAEIYRSLADADATVAGGFLVGGQEPRAVSDRYDKDIATAARLITQAAANSEGSAAARAQIASLNEQLPVYVGLVADARTDNRQGLPLGGAYLRYADQRMREQGGLLDAADRLYRTQTERLGGDYAAARSWPWAAWTLGVLALAALLWAQRRHYRRTNRVFNPGMLAASAACAAVLLWLVVGHTLARAKLEDSYHHGAQSVRVLNNARITVLQARGDENLTLVARGSGDSYEAAFEQGMTALAGKDPRGVGGELAEALALADNSAGRTPVRAAITGVQTWRGRHTTERAEDDGGDYTTAVARVIGGQGSAGTAVTRTTGQCFDAVDASLRQAVAQEQGEFRAAARAGRGVLVPLPFGAGLLAVPAAAGALLGIGRRLSEYR